MIQLDQPIVLVSSPALLSRMPNKIVDAKPLVIFTSGNLLKRSDALWVYQTMGVFPIEVLGSTETGGVAFRQQSDSLDEVYWQSFPTVEIQIDSATQCLKVQSPFFKSTDGFIMGDKVQIIDDGTFQLLERADRIVKIEGKRISLTEIEEKLKQHEFVKDACAVAMTSNRQYIAVVIVLTPEGRAAVDAKGKRAINLTVTNYLSQYIERVLLPKRFRYVDKMPVNKQGKLVVGEFEKLFENDVIKYPNLMSQSQQDEKSIALQLFIPKEIEYFQGHFPDAPLLPGVVQVDWAISFACEFLGVTKKEILSIEQVKFSKAILPEREVTLSLQLEVNKLNFKYFHKDNVYSSGKIRVSK